MSEEALKVPNELIPLLECSICKYVISCGPVYLKKNSENSCGRCVQPRNSRKGSLRNVLYEEIGRFLIFPCKYKNLGCKTELKWDESLQHEENCSYSKKMFSCPILPKDKCTFEGPKNEIMKHCKITHKDSVKNHPFRITSYSNFIVEDMKKLVKTSNKKVLITAHDFLFLIQFQICFISEKISICVSLVDDLEISEHFEFYIEIISNKLERSKFFVQRVLPESKPFDDEHSVNLSFNTSFELTIKRTDVKCSNCEKVLETITFGEMDFCCDDWKFIRNTKLKSKKVLVKCLFSEEGCEYFDKSKNIEKHEAVLCSYSPIAICRKCHFKPLKNKKNIFDHLEQKHVTNSYMGYMVEINTDFNFNPQTILLKNEKGKFLWNYELKVISTMLHGIRLKEDVILPVLCNNDLPYSKERKIKLVAKISFIPHGPIYRRELERRSFDWTTVFHLNPWVIKCYSNFSIMLSIEQ